MSIQACLAFIHPGGGCRTMTARGRALSRPSAQKSERKIAAPINHEGADMPDDPTKAGGQDRERINVHEAYELNAWSKKFGVSVEQVKAAVGKVGDRAADVEAELRNN
jgi:hypothetical protein